MGIRNYVLASAMLFAGCLVGEVTDEVASPELDEITGELEVSIEDYDDGQSVARYALLTGGGRVELDLPAGLADQVRTGSIFTAVGELSDERMTVSSIIAESAEALVPSGTNFYSLGEVKTAVLLVNFSDDPGQPISAADAESLMSGPVDDYYREASNGQTWFTTSVFGYYTIPLSETVCDNYQLATLAEQAAADAGVDLTGFERKLFIFPRNACGWAGLANVGGGAGTYRAWVNGSANLLVAGHELGHTFGLSHAHALDCDGGVLAGTCITRDYGDPADIMGNRKAGHMTAFEKKTLGWLAQPDFAPITTVSATGSYAIAAYSAAGSAAPKALEIVKSTNATTGKRTFYYVEYRQPIGFDSVLATAGNLTAGLFIHLGTEGDRYSSYSLDMTPNSSIYSSIDAEDGALGFGATYTDTTAGVSIRAVSGDGATANVEVTLSDAPPTEPPPPMETLSATVSTDKASYVRGETVTISSLVRVGTQPLSNASVSFRVTKPDAKVVLLTASTDATGTARTSFRLNKRKEPLGSFRVDATTQSGAQTASASATFTVQ